MSNHHNTTRSIFRSTLSALAVMAAAGLAACGGGGGGDGDSGGSAGSGTNPAPPAAPVTTRSTAEGLYSGTTNTGLDVAALILEDGQYYVLYGAGGVVQGVVEGKGASGQTSFTSGDALDFNVVALTRTPGAVSASYTPMGSLAGGYTGGGQTVQFSTRYSSQYDAPASVGEVLGSFSGQAASSGGTGPMTITVTGNGTLSGQATNGVARCNFTGRVTPRASGKHVLDLTVTFGGAGCALGNSTVTGVAVSVAVPLAGGGSRQELYAVGLLPDRSNGFVAVVSR